MAEGGFSWFAASWDQDAIERRLEQEELERQQDAREREAREKAAQAAREQSRRAQLGQVRWRCLDAQPLRDTTAVLSVVCAQSQASAQPRGSMLLARLKQPRWYEGSTLYAPGFLCCLLLMQT